MSGWPPRYSGQTVPCQRCKGRCVIGPVHLNRGDKPHEWHDSMPCPECDGTGSWSLERWERWMDGETFRRARIDRDESLRECARKMGISPSDLSAMERGKKPFPETA